MATQDEISSTEKLLDLIRDQKETASPPDPPAENPQRKSGGAKLFSLGKAVTIGVDIGHNSLKLVKTHHLSDQRFQLLDYKSVPLLVGVDIEHPEFVAFLKTELGKFCGPFKKVKVWTSISSARVETRHLFIPKVPKKQVGNAVYWTFKREVPFNEKSEVFNFDILDEIADSGIPKLEVLAYAAPKTEINRLNALFTKAGFPLSGISLVPFAFQNMLRRKIIQSRGKDVCSLFIGQNWSRIAIYAKGNLVLSRGIKAGIRSMIEAIREGMFTKWTETSLDIPYANENAVEKIINTSPAMGTAQARQTFYDLINNSFAGDTRISAEIGLDEKAAFEMIAPALERLVRQVERTLSHYQLKFRAEEISQIYISGQICRYQRMIDYIGQQLSLTTTVIDPFAADHVLSCKVPKPQSIAEREGFMPAIGISLSTHSLTPNFIFTYRDRETFDKQKIVGRGLFAGLLLIMSVCLWVYIWQSEKVDQKRTILAHLRTQIENQVPLVDKNMVIEHIGRMQRRKQNIEELKKRYFSLAVINEVTGKTPEGIRLLNITTELGGLQDNATPKRIILNGIVAGDAMTYEVALADYLYGLKQSPLFSQPVVRKKSFEFYEDKEVLRFEAQLDLT